jgi:sugar transferase (PEP-CTERM/EpsH1 system associated)
MQLAPPLVLHVVSSFAVGGLENGVVNLINRLPAEHWRHAVLALTTVSPEFCERIRRDDVDFIELKKGPGHLTRFYPQLFALFRRIRPAILHTRNLAPLEAQIPGAIAGVPVRIHGEHGWDVFDPSGVRRRYQLVRRLYRPFVHHYVALSRHLEDYLVHKAGVQARDVSQIYNGVDTVRFHPTAGGRGHIEGSPFGDPGLHLVGTVGRLQPVKDQTNLARAFAYAVRGDSEARRRLRLVVAGEGELRAAMEAILVEAGVKALAWLPGERSDIPDVLRGLDLFALPSLAEGISNTILEAMATGLPVVATRVGGNAELVEDGITGTLVPPENSESLRQGILAYFRDPLAARRHGKAGRFRVEQQFSLDRMASNYEKLYLRLLGRSQITHESIGAAQRSGR